MNPSTTPKARPQRARGSLFAAPVLLAFAVWRLMARQRDDRVVRKLTNGY